MRAKWCGEGVKLGLKEALKSPSQGGFWKQRVRMQISPSCLTDQGKETQHLDMGAAVQPGPPRARPRDAIALSGFPELLTARPVRQPPGPGDGQSPEPSQWEVQPSAFPACGRCFRASTSFR